MKIHDISKIFKTSHEEKDINIKIKFFGDNWLVEIENFYDDIEAVHSYAQSCNYTNHSSIIQMQHIIRSFAPIINIDDCMVEHISTLVGRKIVRETAMPFPPTTNKLDSLGIFSIIPPEIFEKCKKETNNYVPPHRDDFVNCQIYLSGGCGTSFYEYKGEELEGLSDMPSKNLETPEDYEKYVNENWNEICHVDGNPNTLIMFNGQFHHAVDFKRQYDRDKNRIIQNIFYADVTSQLTYDLIDKVDDNDRLNYIILHEFLNNNIVWRTDDPKIQQEKDNYLQGKETILPSETYYQHIRRYDGI